MKTIQAFLAKALFVGALIIGMTSATVAQAQFTGVGATANAGPDQTLTYPTDSTTLSGSSSGINGIVVYYSWSLISGSGTIGSPNSASTNVGRLSTGNNIFRLTATNNTGDTAYDDVTITVSSLNGGGTGATASAGPDQTIYYPSDTVTVSGSSTGINGFAIYYNWTRLSGGGTITSPTTASTSITDLSLGTSVFRFTATNNTGDTAYDDVTIHVLQSGPQLNIPPTAYAGADQTIYTPNSTAYVVGNGTDTDGTITNYAWSKVSGSGVISAMTGGTSGDTATITGLALGTSVFRLTVTDNQGSTAYDDMTITVLNSGTTGGGGGSGGGTSGGGGSYVCPVGTTGIYPNCVMNTSNTNPIYFVNTAKLNIRASASATSAKVATVTNRTLLEVLEGNRSSAWVKVKTNTGVTGYVMTRYTQQLVKIGNKASITVRLVNVRSDESLRYTPLRTIKPTDVVDIIYVSPITSWVKIKSANGQTGFVNKYLLKVV